MSSAELGMAVAEVLISSNKQESQANINTPPPCLVLSRWAAIT